MSSEYDNDDEKQVIRPTGGVYSGQSPLGDAPEAPTPKPKKEKKSGGGSAFAKKFFAAVGLGIIFGLTAGVTLYFMNMINDRQSLMDNKASVVNEALAEEAESEIEGITEDASDEIETVNSDNIAVSADSVPDVADIVEEVMPAVVAINGNYEVTEQNMWGQTYSSETEGSGSGIIIGKDDDRIYIATNNHVVEDSIELKVQFIDGSEASASIKGVDEKMDLAVILVDIDDLDESTRDAIKVAEIGNSDDLRVGETAIAIGNALGYGQSVTVGVISALDRSLDMSDGSTIEHLIQTDAAINPGNSGGALLNSEGKVIGINSSKTGGAIVDSVGFAIPISAAEPILSDIATSETRVKVTANKAGYLGIQGATVTQEASSLYGLPVGVVVSEVYEGTGADKAGLQPGDVITVVDGRIISSMDELREELAYYEDGEIVSVTVSRLKNGVYTEFDTNVELIDKDTLERSNTKKY